MPLSALTVPLGSSPLPNPRMEDPWRTFPSAPQRDQCVMQVVTKKKIGWKRNPYPRQKTEARRLGKSHLTIRGNSLRLSVLRRLCLRLLSAEFSMGKLCVEFTAGNFHCGAYRNDTENSTRTAKVSA